MLANMFNRVTNLRGHPVMMIQQK